MSRYLAGILALVREKMKDELTSDLQDLALEDGELIGHIQTALDEISRAVPKRNENIFSIYGAPDDDYFVVAASISGWSAGGTATLAQTEILPARNITLTVYDPDFDITALAITVTGKLFNAAQTKTFSITDAVFTTDGFTLDTGKLFTELTSIVAASVTGTATGCTIKAGYGPWSYSAITLPTVGPTSMLDLSVCRDKYGMPYFKNILGVSAVEYPVNTDVSGTRNRRNFELSGDLLEIMYDYEIDDTTTSTYQIRLTWDSKYELTFTSTNLPESLEELLVLGATASAFIALGDSKVNTVTLGAAVSGQFKDTGLTKMQLFKRDLAAQIPPSISKSYSRS